MDIFGEMSTDDRIILHEVLIGAIGSHIAEKHGYGVLPSEQAAQNGACRDLLDLSLDILPRGIFESDEHEKDKQRLKPQISEVTSLLDKSHEGCKNCGSDQLAETRFSFTSYLRCAECGNDRTNEFTQE